MAIKALIDTNVWDCSVTHHLAQVQKTVRWGDGSVLTVLAEPQLRQIRPTLQGSLSIYAALARIGDIGRAGGLTIYLSDEVRFERMYRPIRFAMVPEHFVFHGVETRHISGPVRRDFIFTGRKNAANGERQQFFQTINAPRFMELRKRVANRHLLDLYHLWTAEHHELDSFITLDKKFVNAVTRPKPLETRVRVCTPIQFLELFDAGKFEKRQDASPA
jgi:hypothetical protein